MKLVIRPDFYIIDIYFDKYHHQNNFEMQYCHLTITMQTLSVGNRVWSKTTQQFMSDIISNISCDLSRCGFFLTVPYYQQTYQQSKGRLFNSIQFSLFIYA